MSTTMVHVRITDEIKAEAALVLEKMGLTTSDVLRTVLTRIAIEKELPFEIKIPVPVTIKATEAIYRKHTNTVSV